jgi:hypothetical protein
MLLTKCTQQAVCKFLNNLLYLKEYIKKLRGLVRQRTIPIERPPLVGEVIANVV